MASAQRQPKWAQSAAASTAAQYVEACVRCGSQASWQTAAGIAKHGVFALDFGACSHPSFAAACTFLREAPRGICEIQFLDSTRPLSRMMLFRTLARAGSQQKGYRACSKPKLARLRLLASALAVFLAARGSRLEVLDLSSLQLGMDPVSCLSPLSAALFHHRGMELQWLNLSGCHLSNRGFALLLPVLVSAKLPKLQALLVAWNQFSDTHLLDTFLQQRAQLCASHLAAPFQLLDLSGNPDVVVATASRTEARGKRSMHKGAGLLSCISRSLALGLPLRILRLKHLRLTDEDMLPLLRLLRAQGRDCLDESLRAAPVSLEEVDLQSNDLSNDMARCVSEVLQLLRDLRNAPQLHATQEPLKQPQSPGGTASEPEPILERMLDLDDATNWALSDPEVEPRQPPLKASLGPDPLERKRQQRQMRMAANELAKRKPRRGKVRPAMEGQLLVHHELLHFTRQPPGRDSLDSAAPFPDETSSRGSSDSEGEAKISGPAAESADVWLRKEEDRRRGPGSNEAGAFFDARLRDLQESFLSKTNHG